MSKMNRFLIVLAVLACSIVFMFPSIQWYAFTPPEAMALSMSSKEQIRDFALDEADRVLLDLEKQARDGVTAPVAAKYAYLIAEAAKYWDQYKLTDATHPRPTDDKWKAADVLRAFSYGNSSADEAKTRLRKSVEKYHRDSILAVKGTQASAVKMGLDLAGGVSLVLNVNFDAYAKKLQEIEKSRNQAQSGATQPDTTQPVAGPTAPAGVAEPAATQSATTYTLSQAEKEDAMKRTLEILSDRINQFGLTEPVIRQMGDDKIYIELPGTPDTAQIDSIISTSGRMAFTIVDTDATNKLRDYLASQPKDELGRETGIDANGVCKDPTIIPVGWVARKYFVKDEYGIDKWTGNWVVVATIPEKMLDGSHIVNAKVDFDEYGRSETNFEFDTEGGSIFAKLTGENKGKMLAVIVNDRVKLQATIKDVIPNGRVVLSGDFTQEEAENYAKILKTSVLPTELSKSQELQIGASQGVDYIIQGRNALIIGLLAVFAFMWVYYKGAGLNAMVAQILNLIIMFAILSVFGLTLTLPTIAGFVLTIGMAVDANVIIYERIKEELRLGKGRRASIDAGFHKAFWAVMDGNITTIIAAILLSQLGTGAIRGFAISLAIGNIASLFTALFVSRLIFDFETDVLKAKHVSISWRVK